MDPRSKPNAAIHQFLVSGRGAVAVEFADHLGVLADERVISAAMDFESADCIAC